MEEFVVYILYSEKYNKHYTGYTSDLIGRFRSHNELAKKGFTIRYRPWKVIYLEFFKLKKKLSSEKSFLNLVQEENG